MADTPDFGTLDVTDFSVGAMLRTGLALRRAVRGATSLETAADAIVRYLFEHCTDASGVRTCALVRFYTTQPYGGLPRDLQQYVDRQLGGQQADNDLRCLTLMATVGELPAWNDRRSSRGHQAIALSSADSIRAAPMIVRLIEDIGIDIDTLVGGAEPARQAPGTRNYGVFHVEGAVGSPFIPAQDDFVIPHRIASVIGFGGLLRSGEMFSVVLFSHERIPAASAARFKAIALDVRSSLFTFDQSGIWAQ